jgi:hypothetical protein
MENKTSGRSSMIGCLYFISQLRLVDPYSTTRQSTYCATSLCRDRPVDFKLVINNPQVHSSYVHFIRRILHSGCGLVPTHVCPFDMDAYRCHYPELRLLLCDSGMIHTQKCRTGCSMQSSSDQLNNFLRGRNARFYRPWRLAATSHHDLVPPPDIVQ